MSGFTKGPWQFIDATKVAGMHFKPLCVIKAGDKQVASFSWNDNSKWFPTKDESQANARLIAAAPELYERLKEARDAIASLPEYALGGEDLLHPHDGEVVGHYPIRDELLSNIDAALSKAAGEGV